MKKSWKKHPKKFGGFKSFAVSLQNLASRNGIVYAGGFFQRLPKRRKGGGNSSLK
jgi:hypothetical protein